MAITRRTALVLAVLAGVAGAGWAGDLERDAVLAAMRCPSGMMSTPYGHPLAQMLMRAPSPPRALLNKRDDLDLTQDQVEQLRQMDIEYSMAQIDRKAEMEKGLVQVREILDQEPVATANLRTGLENLAGTAIDMIIAWVEVDQNAEAVLTAEQRGILDAMMRGRAGARPRRPRHEEKGEEEQQQETSLEKSSE